jgi:hypothetical protein
MELQKGPHFTYIKYFTDLNLKHLYPKIEEYYNQKALRGKGSLTGVFTLLFSFSTKPAKRYIKLKYFTITVIRGYLNNGVYKQSSLRTSDKLNCPGYWKECILFIGLSLGSVLILSL